MKEGLLPGQKRIPFALLCCHAPAIALPAEATDSTLVAAQPLTAAEDTVRGRVWKEGRLASVSAAFSCSSASLSLSWVRQWLPGAVATASATAASAPHHSQLAPSAEDRLEAGRSALGQTTLGPLCMAAPPPPDVQILLPGCLLAVPLLVLLLRPHALRPAETQALRSCSADVQAPVEGPARAASLQPQGCIMPVVASRAGSRKLSRNLRKAASVWPQRLAPVWGP